jgi:hypothetical protein
VPSPGFDALQEEIAGHRDPKMHVADDLGYVDLIPAEIAGFEVMRRRCLDLVDARRPALTGQGKKAYLRPVLEAQDYLAHPEILQYCLDPKLLAAAADYLGEPPVLRMAQLFWTPQNETEDGSQRWHYDHIPPRQLKLFINLAPVSQDTGPFTFLPADASAAFMSAIGRNWEQANIKTYTDAEVAAHCDKTDIRRLLGPAGTGGFVDTTRCLHYGGRTRRGERVLMIIQYTRRDAPKKESSHWPVASHPARLGLLQRAAIEVP